jgi:hypothetical protein
MRGVGVDKAFQKGADLVPIRKLAGRLWDGAIVTVCGSKRDTA